MKKTLPVKNMMNELIESSAFYSKRPPSASVDNVKDLSTSPTQGITNSTPVRTGENIDTPPSTPAKQPVASELSPVLTNQPGVDDINQKGNFNPTDTSDKSNSTKQISARITRSQQVALNKIYFAINNGDGGSVSHIDKSDVVGLGIDLVARVLANNQRGFKDTAEFSNHVFTKLGFNPKM